MLGYELELDDLRYRLSCQLAGHEDLGLTDLSARLINGIGTGMLNVIVPVWVRAVLIEALQLFSLIWLH